MNFQDLLEKLFVETGYPDTGNSRPDYLLQQYKDALNVAQDEICATCAPSLEHLIQESTLNVVANTSDYLLGDWCQRPLSLWTEDVMAHKINFRRPKAADRDGSRNTILVPYTFGPYMVTLLPRTSTPALSGASGSSTGASVTNGSTAVTFGSSGPVLTSDLVGRMLKLNGESEDYKITAITDHGCTTDRPVIARMRGAGSTNIGADYTNVRWEIGPVGRFMVRFLPKPTASSTVFFRYMAYPRKMIEPSDTPQMQEDMHHLIWKGAMRAIGATKQNQTMYQMYTNEFAASVQLLKASDIDDDDSADGPNSEWLMDNVQRGVLPGTYSRFGAGQGGWYY